MNIREAAVHLGLTTDGVKKALHRGKLSGTKIQQAGSICPVWDVPTASVQSYREARHNKKAASGS